MMASPYSVVYRTITWLQLIFVLIRPPVSFESINGSCKHYCVSILQQKFDKLILMKITTRCLILKLKCTKLRLPLGLCPSPRWGAYSAPPDSLAGFKRPTSTAGERRKVGGEGKRKGHRREGEGGEGRGWPWTLPLLGRSLRAYGGAEVRFRPHPFGRRTAYMTPSLTILLICDNGTVLWRHHRQCNLFKRVQHGTQNTQNDCHHWLSGSFSLPNSFWAGAPPRTPLGELTALPQTP